MSRSRDTTAVVFAVFALIVSLFLPRALRDIFGASEDYIISLIPSVFISGVALNILFNIAFRGVTERLKRRHVSDYDFGKDARGKILELMEPDSGEAANAVHKLVRVVKLSSELGLAEAGWMLNLVNRCRLASGTFFIAAIGIMALRLVIEMSTNAPAPYLAELGWDFGMGILAPLALLFMLFSMNIQSAYVRVKAAIALRLLGSMQ